MSAHLMIVAGYLDLPLSHKLTLMKIADSADERSRLGYPGLDTARLWSGTKKSRALSIVKELQEWGLIMQVEAGHRGHRAVYKVFPDAGDEVFSLAAKRGQVCPGADLFAGNPGIPNDEEIAKRIAAMDATAGAMKGSAAPNAKGTTDRTQSIGSDRLDPIRERVQPDDGKGPVSGPIGSDRSDPFGTNLQELHLREPRDADASPDVIPLFEDLTGLSASPEPDSQGTDKTTDPSPARPRGSSKGTRIPGDFKVTDDMRQWAADNGFGALPLDQITEEFFDYWIAQPGQKGVKADWPATWRNWIRRDQQFIGGRERGRNTTQSRVDASDGLWARAARRQA